MSNPFETMERLVRRRTRHLEFTEKTGELNIVPYLDIMVNLIMFMLVTITSSISLSVLGVSAPKYNQQVGGGPTTPPKAELQLTVFISMKGFIVQARGEYIGSGGNPLPKGAPRPENPSIEKEGENYQFAKLTDLVERFKNDNATESRVILVSDHRVVYDTVIKAMDALRSKGKKELFPDVFLGTL